MLTGSSKSDLSMLLNRVTVAPSSTLWSALHTKVAMSAATTSILCSSLNTGSLLVLPMAPIATDGAMMTGIPNAPPI